MDSRNPAQDIAKGLAITAVVIGHVYDGLRGAGVAPVDGVLHAMLYFFYLWHMPLFFLFAGYNARQTLSRETTREFVFRQVRFLVPMYFFWSVLQVGLKAFAVQQGGSVNHPIEFSELTRILYDPVDQFWFLYALFVCHLLHTLSKDKPRVALAIGLTAFAGSQVFLPSILDTSAGSFVQLSLYDMPFYFIGAFGFDRIMSRLRAFSTWKMASLLAVVFIGSFTAGMALGLFERHIVLLPASVSMVFLVALLGEGIAARKFAQLIAFLGRNSLVIFIMHVIFAAAIRTLLLKMGIQVLWAHLSAGVVAGMGLSLLAQEVMRRLKIQKFFFLR